MGRLNLVTAFVGALFFTVAPVTALGAAQPDSSRADQEIVVTGQKLEVLDAYIRQLTEAPQGQIARWNDRICPRAVGLAPSQNAYLANSIGEVARQIRIPVERGSCHANILIVVTDEADKFVRLMLKRHPRLFGAYGSRTPSAAAVATLLAPRPVRWINGSVWGSSDGTGVVDGMNHVTSMSRLEETTRENATLSLVIVDSTALQKLTWGALSSYLAMVALARPAPDIDTGNSATILSLFRNRDEQRAGPKSLTRWDRAFLKGLYTSKANVKAATQRRAIRKSMEKTMQGSEGQQPEE